MNRFITALTLAIAALPKFAITVDWTCSTDAEQWRNGGNVEITPYDRHVPNDILITNYTDQQIQGFGACFNELGWIALGHLDKQTRNSILNDLFSPEGANFTINRTPIGANDFATEWYSYDETDGDFELKRFSIKHDKRNLIPYIKAALKINPDMKLWASPWSPPQWMKTNRHYSNRADKLNGLSPDKEVPTGNDQFIQEEKYLRTYSKYFSRYVEEYAKKGIKISMIQFQNEPYTFNIWPNTSWTPKGMTNFIGNYLGPEFEKNHPDVELWLGTLNTNNMEHIDFMLNHPTASKYIKGIGFQWEGKDVVDDVHRKYLDLPIIQTENECGSGDNDWKAAEYTFSLIKKYIQGGASIYTYWNMVLQDECLSTWGWSQNALFVVDSKAKTVRCTPEYYVMKHFSHFVKPGAMRLHLMGLTDKTLAFRNPDGSVICVMHNPDDSARKVAITFGDSVITVNLEPHSFNTFTINE